MLKSLKKGGEGKSGQRAANFRFWWEQSGGGSSPLIRTRESISYTEMADQNGGDLCGRVPLQEQSGEQASVEEIRRGGSK